MFDTSAENRKTFEHVRRLCLPRLSLHVAYSLPGSNVVHKRGHYSDPKENLFTCNYGQAENFGTCILFIGL